MNDWSRRKRQREEFFKREEERRKRLEEENDDASNNEITSSSSLSMSYASSSSLRRRTEEQSRLSTPTKKEKDDTSAISSSTPSKKGFDSHEKKTPISRNFYGSTSGEGKKKSSTPLKIQRQSNLDRKRLFDSPTKKLTKNSTKRNTDIDEQWLDSPSKTTTISTSRKAKSTPNSPTSKKGFSRTSGNYMEEKQMDLDDDDDEDTDDQTQWETKESPKGYAMKSSAAPSPPATTYSSNDEIGGDDDDDDDDDNGNNNENNNSDEDDDGDDDDDSVDLIAAFRKHISSEKKNSPGKHGSKSSPNATPASQGQQPKTKARTTPLKSINQTRNKLNSSSRLESPSGSYNNSEIHSNSQASEPDMVDENSGSLSGGVRNGRIGINESDSETEDYQTPSNPIALMKQEEEQAKILSQSAKVDHHGIEANLWSDSDNDEDEDDGSQTRTTRKKGTGRYRKSTPTQKSKRAKKKSLGEMVLGEYSGHGIDDTDEYGSARSDRGALRTQLHPTLDNPPFGPDELKPLKLRGPTGHQVPASLNRYLAPFQREGVKFLHNCLVNNNTGAILGDDMGVGKTAQILSLLCALYGKTGTGQDIIDIDRRKEAVWERLRVKNQAQHERLLLGHLPAEESMSGWQEELNLPKWYPVLIIVPPTTLQNWRNEFKKFTHFEVASYHGENRSMALESLQHGRSEVMLATKSLFGKSDFAEINKVAWKLVIIDEFHLFKNKDSHIAINLRQLTEDHQSLVVGMTGTLMQNDHSELWNLIDLVETGFLGSWEEFKLDVAIPIKLGRAKTATADAIRRSNETRELLNERLKEIMIERKKGDVLKDRLPDKSEQLILCELSELQKKVYQHVLSLPDFELVKKAQAPCDCDVNKVFFQRYQRLKSPVERLDFYRRNKDQIVMRKKCCHKIPTIRGPDGKVKIDPDAALWRMLDAHKNEQGCDHCPLCCCLPAITKLDKIANHVSLVQAHNEGHEVGSPEYTSHMKELEFAKVALLDDVVKQLPGKSRIRRSGVLDKHFELSGKIKVLDKLLKKFYQEGSRVLLFSHSTQTLDLIQNYIRSKGHTFSRMDGTTPTSKRQELADNFKKDSNCFVFLLSTRAMGLGINLNAANKVIIFDVNWNPSWDEQAQDRAYRIGQENDVQVIRLVSRGTVDELKYLRQLYKVQLKDETLQKKDTKNIPKAARFFRGVQGDKDRKGELFGMENILKYKDGCFLDDIWKQVGKGKKGKRKSSGSDFHDTDRLTRSLQEIGEAACDRILDDAVNSLDRIVEERKVKKHTEGGLKDDADDDEMEEEPQQQTEQENGSQLDFGAQALDTSDLFRSDRGRAAVEEGDEGWEEEMGGMTQTAVAVYEEGGMELCENPQDGYYDGEDDNDVLVSTSNEYPINDDNVNDLSPTRQGRPNQRTNANNRLGQRWRSSAVDEEEDDTMSDQGIDDDGSDDDDEPIIHAAKPAKRRKIEPKKSSSSTSPSKSRSSRRAIETTSHKQLHLLKSSPGKIHLVGTVPTKGTKTTFSAADLSIPSYLIGRKRRKKK